MQKGSIIGWIVFACLSSIAAVAQPNALTELQAQADTLVNHDEFEKAVPLYTRIVQDAQATTDVGFQALYKRSYCYYRLDRFEDALKDLDVIIAKLPELKRPHLLRAYVYRELDDADHQLTDLNFVLQDSQPEPDLLKWRASLLLDKEDFTGAKRDLLIVKSMGEDPHTETLLAMMYQNSGNPDSAIVSINNAIVLDPEGESSYLYGASFSLQEENYELALKYIAVALRLKPDSPTALLYKGIALVELSKVDEGCRCLKKSFDAGQDDAGDYLKQYCYGSD